LSIITKEKNRISGNKRNLSQSLVKSGNLILVVFLNQNLIIILSIIIKIQKMSGWKVISGHIEQNPLTQPTVILEPKIKRTL